VNGGHPSDGKVRSRVRTNDHVLLGGLSGTHLLDASQGAQGSGSDLLSAATKVTGRSGPPLQEPVAIDRTRPNACSLVGAATATRNPAMVPGSPR
jgi:hypothetical protein